MVLQQGSVVSVPVNIFGYLVDHEGIVVRGAKGEARIISNSKKNRCVKEESWAEFQSGAVGPVTIRYVAPPYQGDSIVERAKSKIGQGWELLSSNCEHFTRWARNLPIESPQLQRGLKVATGLAIAFVIWVWKKLARYLKI